MLSWEREVADILFKQRYHVIFTFFGHDVILIDANEPNNGAVIVSNGKNLLAECDGDIFIEGTSAYITLKIGCKYPNAGRVIFGGTAAGDDFLIFFVILIARRTCINGNFGV